VLNQIINHLEIADQYEWNAKRVLELCPKPPNWAYTYIECLADASRERAVARMLVMEAYNNSRKSDLPVYGVKSRELRSEIRDTTLGQLVRLVAVAKGSPAGSERMRHVVQRLNQIAQYLDSNGIMSQLLWWCEEVEPVPPGRPIFTPKKREQEQ
jgi:hypothetical protein